MNFSILFSDKKINTFDEALLFLNDCQVWKFFDDRAISFVNKFSSMLLKYPAVNKFPDLVALAYWFRRSNVKKLKEVWDGKKWKEMDRNEKEWEEIGKHGKKSQEIGRNEKKCEEMTRNVKEREETTRNQKKCW